ncbi:DUF2953 domain-containing protein [Shouchella shacheensis]|uniref:DUF2953 domain-containing protein n=1 Tax=Shouchella shacheensis TaxID=1649580 RepID=UPI0007400C17|nr:DUF2953 domain-containing protein [Shouchella shacheensis]
MNEGNGLLIILFIIGAGLILFFILLMLAKITVQITYSHQYKEDLLTARITAWRIPIYTLETSVMEWNEEDGSLMMKEETDTMGAKEEKTKKWTLKKVLNIWHDAQALLRHVVHLKKKADRFLAQVHVHHFCWKTELGVGDAAATAQLAGALWAIKGLVSSWLTRKMLWRTDPKLQVTPHFQTSGFALYFSCMLSFRLGHAIRAGLALALGWKRRPKTKAAPNKETGVSS